jgi:protein ImuB
MSRIVSVWLRSWPIARLLKASATPADVVMPSPQLDPKRPLALVAPGPGGPRIAALNRAAQQGGLSVGELVSNARSKVLDLQTHEADPAADAEALRRLALWALRYSPIVAPWDEASGADGLFIDISGCAHLFGGEAGLLTDLDRRLRAFGLAPRLAIADTAGVAWGLAHYGNGESAIVPSGQEARVLALLPLAALRLPGGTLSLLGRVGLRRIGEVVDRPRAPLAARFEALLLRLDQALGRAPESLIPVVPPPVYREQATFVEPITASEHVLEAAVRLLADLAQDLARDAAGARSLRLLLFRVMPEACFQHDGGVQSLDIGLAEPSRDAQHIARLIALRLDRLAGGLDAEFGFEAAAVHVLVAEPLADRQTRLTMQEATVPPEALAQLIDRLQQRLGSGAVRQLHPHQSHIPERAVRACKAIDRPRVFPPPCGEGGAKRRVGGSSQASSLMTPTPNPSPQGGGEPARDSWQAVGTPSAPRPLLLLPRPEPAEVVALIPEGPPRQFRWRGVRHQVAHAQGPERIAPEWWRRITGDVERDYYVVEDTAGRRFWLYRAGLYGRGGDASPQWFVHGVFG